MAKNSATSSERDFGADEYLSAAKERVEALEPLYDAEEHVLVIYIAGLAVEAMLRDYRHRIDPEFDSRHDLHELARAAKFAKALPASKYEYFSEALANVAIRWSNSHRFRSAPALKRFLKKARLDRGIKGDFVKENARLAIIYSRQLVVLGVALWKRK